MFCENCGNQIPENVKFCPNCGKENIEMRSAGAEKQEKREKDGRRHKKTKWFLLIFVLLLIAAGVGGSIYYRAHLGYEVLLKKWFHAMETADAKIEEEIYAEQWMDHKYSSREEFLSYEQSCLENNLEIFEEYCGVGFHFTYEVTEKNIYSKEELNELIEELQAENWIQESDELTEAVEITGIYTASGDNGVVNDQFWAAFTKINGEWKLWGLTPYGFDKSGTRLIALNSSLSWKWYKDKN